MILTAYLYWVRSNELSISDNILAATRRFRARYDGVIASKIIVNPKEYDLYKSLNLDLKIIEDKNIHIGSFGIQ